MSDTQNEKKLEKWKIRELLGSGLCGIVRKAVDVDDPSRIVCSLYIDQIVIIAVLFCNSFVAVFLCVVIDCLCVHTVIAHHNLLLYDCRLH